jgi:DNA-directed RNA polymerase specialized sigma24 family protein
MNEVTQVLNAVGRGQAQAADLLPLVYEELRKLAAHKMAHEPAGQTLQPTALVHEAWLRLVDKDGQSQFDNRAHFFGAAAEAMRRILIDRARRKQAQRHGGAQQRLDIQEVDIAAEPRDDELVKLRYFVGLSLAEAADILGISEPTAKRHWAFARAWLQAEINAMQKPFAAGGTA